MNTEVETEVEVETDVLDEIDKAVAAREVKLGDRVIKLGVPKSMGLFWEVHTAQAVNDRRAWAAALGMCWEAGTSLGCPGKYSETYKPLVYGGKVMDELLNRGIPYHEIVIASVVAYRVLGEKPLQLIANNVESIEKN